MYTLGINAAFHDSSACINKDGQLIAAAEEERFTQIKHGKRPIPFSTSELPFHAIDYCLKMANIHLGMLIMLLIHLIRICCWAMKKGNQPLKFHWNGFLTTQEPVFVNLSEMK